jgi:ectoine hydroxylase
MWTDDQFAQFNEQGYLCERGLLSQQEIDELISSTQQAADDEANSSEVHVVRESSGALRTIFRLHKKVESCRQIIRDSRISDPLKQIFNDDAYVFHSKLNVKAGFEGAVWLWHQDYGYWQFDGMKDNMTSVLIMLDKTTLYNGNMLFVAGSHKWGVLDHYSDEVSTSYKQWCITPDVLKEKITDESMFTPVIGEPGDVFYFDCNIVHGSGHNMSPLPRRSLIFACAAMSNQPTGKDDPRPDWVVARDFESITSDMQTAARA